MKQLLILSGKGGTGKTTVAAAFIRLSEARAYADCDVDAPNLHLTLHQTAAPECEPFYGMPKARIRADACTACGLCAAHCRFEAVSRSGAAYTVDPFACEGCGVCEAVCPAGAVSMHSSEAGELMRRADETAVFSTARLKMGSGTTGKLVTQVKRRLHEAAPPEAPLAILDGSPGIGCPVIASLSGVSMALIVAEPSVSGQSDMGRIIQTARQFQTPLAVCVNKADTNPGMTERIRCFCTESGIPFAGTIPFDPKAVDLVNRNLTIVDAPCPSGRAVRAVFAETMRLMEHTQEQQFKNKPNGGTKQ